LSDIFSIVGLFQ